MARARHGDALQRDIGADGALVEIADRFAQGQDAARIGVEGAAVLQRLDGGLADEGRGHQVGLAEPQRQDIGIAQPQRGDLGDAGGLQVADDGADGVFAGLSSWDRYYRNRSRA